MGIMKLLEKHIKRGTGSIAPEKGKLRLNILLFKCFKNTIKEKKDVFSVTRKIRIGFRDATWK